MSSIPSGSFLVNSSYSRWLKYLDADEKKAMKKQGYERQSGGVYVKEGFEDHIEEILSMEDIIDYIRDTVQVQNIDRSEPNEINIDWNRDDTPDGSVQEEGNTFIQGSVSDIDDLMEEFEESSY